MTDGPRTTILGKLVILLFIAGCGWLAWYFFAAKAGPGGAPQPGGAPTPTGKGVEIGIAYGTEKQRWMEWAAKQFAETDAGRGVTIDLMPMGSLEGAQALVRGDQRIHAWSPASSLYKETFVADWQVKYGNQPILATEQLALTPMVFVWWEERWQAFAAKYPQCTFANLGLALAERGGWDALAGKPEWGLVKFGHTHPNQSNSGLVTLVLMAYEYQKRDRGLTMKDILDPGFQGWLGGFESAVSSLPNSTGTMMKEMVLKGPSSFDAVMVYENVAIDYLKNAEGRWGALRLIYPQTNMWNDNPFYIIDASWSSPEQRKATKDFLAFLMSEPVQREALTHGFRPGNPNVGVRFPGSPFEVFQKNGLRNDLSAICETPKGEVVTNLLESWQRARGKPLGMWSYLREAFLAGPEVPGIGRLPINVLAVAAFGVFGFAQPGFWFLGLALESAYLFALATNARFQRAVDAAALAAPDDGLERKRRALMEQLSDEDRARLTQIDAKCERLAQLNASADDGLPTSDAEAVARLRWMCLKLLFARRTLRDQGSDAQARVEAQVAQLRQDLAGELAASLRDSKAATLEVLTRRLESLRRRDESLAEIDSDLTRLEAQLDLAIDNAAMRGKPVALGPSLDLVGRLLDPDVFGEAREVVADLDQAFPAATPKARPQAGGG